MKVRLILALSISLFSIQALAADYRYVVPMPRPAPEKVADPAVPHIVPYQVAALHLAQTNPDPFNTKGVPQTTQVQAQPGQPVIVQAQPAAQSDLRDWLQTGLMGVIAAIFAKLGFAKPAPVPVPAATGAPPTMTDLSDAFERALLKVVQSGVPGTAIQGGLGLIPGVGPIAAQLEPMIRKITIDALNQKLGLDPQTGISQPGGSFLDLVGNVVENRIKAALDRRATP